MFSKYDIVTYFGGYYYVVVALGVDPKKVVEEKDGENDKAIEEPYWISNLLCSAT